MLHENDILANIREEFFHLKEQGIFKTDFIFKLFFDLDQYSSVKSILVDYVHQYDLSSRQLHHVLDNIPLTYLGSQYKDIWGDRLEPIDVLYISNDHPQDLEVCRLKDNPWVDVSEVSFVKNACKVTYPSIYHAAMEALFSKREVILNSPPYSIREGDSQYKSDAEAYFATNTAFFATTTSDYHLSLNLTDALTRQIIRFRLGELLSLLEKPIPESVFNPTESRMLSGAEQSSSNLYHRQIGFIMALWRILYNLEKSILTKNRFRKEHLLVSKHWDPLYWTGNFLLKREGSGWVSSSNSFSVHSQESVDAALNTFLSRYTYIGEDFSIGVVYHPTGRVLPSGEGDLYIDQVLRATGKPRFYHENYKFF